MLLTGDASAITTLLDAGKNAITFSGTVLTTMIENPVYAFLFGAGLVSIGINIVVLLKNAARR